MGTSRYTNLTELCTKYYLPITATLVPSKRAFSVAGEVVSIQKEFLLLEQIQQLIFSLDSM